MNIVKAKKLILIFSIIVLVTVMTIVILVSTQKNSFYIVNDVKTIAIVENKDLQEQSMLDDQKIAINAGTKAFLDAKKIQGKDLTDRIKQYQLSIPNCEPTGHMMDCKDMLPENDKKLWQSLMFGV